MEILNDFSTSVIRALSEIDKDWESYDGLVVCGTHSPHDVEMMIDKIRQARESGRPFLGICFGHQLAAIEYARNVLGIKDATSEEFGQGTFVVKKLPGWEKPNNFITVQFHFEYQSSKQRPHLIGVQFLKMCKNYKKTYA